MRYVISGLSIVCIALFVNVELSAQDCENVEQIGRIYNDWDMANDIVLVGEIAYVAAGLSGLQIVDVSDPENPVITGYWDNNPQLAIGVAVSGDYAYLSEAATYSGNNGFDSGGLWILSLEDPDNPMEISYLDLQGAAYSIDVSGENVLLADHQNGMRIISVADPEHPEEIASLGTRYADCDLMVSGDFAYIADGRGGLRINSIIDPENPEEIGSYQTPGEARGVHVIDDRAYIADGYGGLRVIDISQPENPTELGYVLTDHYANDVSVVGEYAYVADRFSLRIISIADPENPVEIGFHDDRATRVIGSGDYAYVVFIGGYLRVISISDPEIPEQIGGCGSNISIKDIIISEGLLYSANGHAGLGIISIADQEHPTEIGSHDTEERAFDVAVSGDYAYIANYVNGMRVISIADPEHPEEVGFFDPDERDRTTNITVSGNYAYTTGGCFRVISISDPENPEGLWSNGSTSTSGDIVVSNDYVFIAQYSRSGLLIFSIADPENPVFTSFFETDGYASDIVVRGDYAYFADWDGGLLILSIADPENPFVVGCFEEDVNSVAISGDYAYVTCARSGLRVVSISDPEHPVEVGYYDTPGYANEVAISEDGLIYVDDRTHIGVYRFTDPNAVDDPITILPENFHLLTVHPNPFNSTTTITYGLQSPGNVTLQLYNPFGQRISTLFEGNRQAGIYTTNLTGRNMISGLYFIRLEGSGQVFTQKVMLIR